jgi:hypothetical protein
VPCTLASSSRLPTTWLRRAYILADLNQVRGQGRALADQVLAPGIRSVKTLGTIGMAVARWTLIGKPTTAVP